MAVAAFSFEAVALSSLLVVEGLFLDLDLSLLLDAAAAFLLGAMMMGWFSGLSFSMRRRDVGLVALVVGTLVKC